MCCEEENATASWHSTVADFASQSARWCLTWMPCSSLRNRIHPTILDESTNSKFLLLDLKKRLHIIHLCPDSTHPSVLIGFKKVCCLDATDSGNPGSPDSTSLEEYWFTKSSRPLHQQINPCRCSFRGSMRPPVKSKEETKDSVDNAKPVVQRKARGNVQIKPEIFYNYQRFQLTQSQTVERIADSLSAEIISQVIDECVRTKQATHCFDVISTSVEHLASDNNHCPCNDTVCSKRMDFSLDEFREMGDLNLNSNAMTGLQATGGYMNPTFVGSNTSIDKLTDNEPLVVNTHFESSSSVLLSLCDGSHNLGPNHNSLINDINQDFNANEKDIVTKKNKRNDSSKIQEDYVGRKHHKECSFSSKPCQKKPLLFFLHGAGHSAAVWKTLMTSMVAAGYECVAPDLLGHGLSSTPHKASYYTFHNLLKDLLKVFDEFVAKGRSAVLLGHGYGCSFATAISRFRAEQVVQLVLISGGGPSPLAPPKSGPPSPFMISCLDPLLLCGFKRDVMFSMYGKQLIGCTAEECAVPPIILRNLAKGHIWPEGDTAFHRRVTAPTLLVHGLRDTNVTLVQQCEMERTVPRSFLEVIPEAGHCPMLDAPDSLSHMVLCFIDWWAQ